MGSGGVGVCVAGGGCGGVCSGEGGGNGRCVGELQVDNVDQVYFDGLVKVDC